MQHGLRSIPGFVFLALLLVSSAAFGSRNAAVTASPTSVNFGSIAVGATASQTITIKNTGFWRVTISSMSTSGPGFSASGLTLPMTLRPGMSATFTATFSPSNAGTASGDVYLNLSNGSPIATVALSGSGTNSGSTTGSNPVQHSVSLSWTGSTSTVIGYYVYRGATTGGPYTRITSSVVDLTSYVDSSVASGSTYFYVVTAVDSSYVESPYSNETEAVIPNP